MGAGGEDLLVLVEEPARGRRGGTRASTTSRCFTRRGRSSRAPRSGWPSTRTPISGASDHGISEAIYLPDPDGNGIELAADRPRERWGDLSDPTRSARDRSTSTALLETVADEEPRPQADPGPRRRATFICTWATWSAACAFYRDVIGFDVMTHFPSAAFVSAGGYHHHLAFNTWRGEGVPPAPPDAVGLRHWTVAARGPVRGGRGSRARGGGRHRARAARRRAAPARPLGQRGALRG